MDERKRRPRAAAGPVDAVLPPPRLDWLLAGPDVAGEVPRVTITPEVERANNDCATSAAAKFAGVLRALQAHRMDLSDDLLEAIAGHLAQALRFQEKRKPGRRRTESAIEEACVNLYKAKQPVAEICRRLEIVRDTCYAILERYDVETDRRNVRKP